MLFFRIVKKLKLIRYVLQVFIFYYVQAKLKQESENNSQSVILDVELMEALHSGNRTIIKTFVLCHQMKDRNAVS